MDYWRILRRRKALVILTVLLMGLSGLALATFREPTPMYQACASLKMEKVKDVISIIDGPADAMTTEAHVVTSFPVMVQSAKDLGWLDEDLSPQEIRNSKLHLSDVDRLRSMIEVNTERGTSIIDIVVTSNEPHKAAKVANTVLKAYQSFNILERNKPIREMGEFIEDELNSTFQRMEEAEENLRTFKEKYNLMSPEAETSHVLDRLSAAQAEYEKVKTKINEISFQLSAIEGRRITPKSLAQAVYCTEPGSATHRLARFLRDLSLKKARLLADFTERHPQVKDIDTQMESVQKELRGELLSYLKALKGREKELSVVIGQWQEQSQHIPEKALRLARLQREVALYENLYVELKKRRQEILIQEAGTLERVTIVQPATVPTLPKNMRSDVRFTAIGIIMGILLGMVFAFVSESLDTSVGTIEDIEGFLQAPVLGVIPSLEMADKAEKKDDVEKASTRGGGEFSVHLEPHSTVAESYRSLCSNLKLANVERQRQTFLIASASLRGEKTRNVASLGLSMAQEGERVLLVEGDLRSPTIHEIFGLDRVPGLTDYVLGYCRWHEVVNTITDVLVGELDLEDLLRAPGLDYLTIVTAGTAFDKPLNIVTSPRFVQFLKEARGEYDVILLDAPPVLAVPDATEIASRVDGVILVHEVGSVTRGGLKKARSRLTKAHAKVVGLILNGVNANVA